MSAILKKDYSSNLVAQYNFEETSGSICVDSLGYYNGTYYGTTSIVGVVGNGRSFNGTSDYISFSNQILPIGKKSIKFKIKTTANINNQVYNIFDNSNNLSTNKGLSCYLYNGKIEFTFFRGVNNAYDSITSTININDGNYHTVLLTWTGDLSTNGIRLYIDNMLLPHIQQTATYNETTIQSYNLAIGRQANLNTCFFEGQLDEFEIYNDVVEYIDKKFYLIKYNNQYYTIKSTNYDLTTHNFSPLTLLGGTNPNGNDIQTFGFDDLSLLTNGMIIESDTFNPIDKFDSTSELKLFK